MEEGKPGREVAVSLRWEALSECPDGLASSFCLHCRGPLDIHQPDSVLPDRMLATCAACGSWHLIDCQATVAPSFVLLLPDAATIRAAQEAK
jgi:hypothetical protein